jgi:hypothetical protein
MLFYQGALVLGRVQGSIEVDPLYMESLSAIFLIQFVPDGVGIFASLAWGKMRHFR